MRKMCNKINAAGQLTFRYLTFRRLTHLNVNVRMGRSF